MTNMNISNLLFGKAAFSKKDFGFNESARARITVFLTNIIILWKKVESIIIYLVI